MCIRKCMNTVLTESLSWITKYPQFLFVSAWGSTLNALASSILYEEWLLPPIFCTDCRPPFTYYSHKAWCYSVLLLLTLLYWLNTFAALGTGPCAFISPLYWPSHPFLWALCMWHSEQCQLKLSNSSVVPYLLFPPENASPTSRQQPVPIWAC